MTLTRRNRWRFTLRWLMGLIAVAASASYFFASVGAQRLMTFPMTWRMGEPGYEGSKQAHIILAFRDYPGHVIGASSDDLAGYLQELGSDTVDVTFAVTTDWGHVRGFHVVRIGDLASWRWEKGREGFYSGSVSVGNQVPGPSPFP